MRRVIVILVVLVVAGLAFLVGDEGRQSKASPEISTPVEARKEIVPAGRLAEPSADEQPMIREADDPDPGNTDVDILRATKELDVAHGRIQGRVVDIRTTEPVSGIDVEIALTGRVASTQTDDEGWFSIGEYSPKRAPAIRLIDDGLTIGSFEHDGSEPWLLPIDIGPTYPLVLDEAGLGGGELRARVVESVREVGTAGVLEVTDRGLVVARDRSGLPDRDWSWVRVRDAKAFPWIRFPSVEYEPDERYVLRVEVRSTRTGREGSGKAQKTIGRQPPVRVHYERTRGTLCGVVFDSSGQRVSGASILLLPPRGDTRNGPPLWNEAFTAEDGSFAFEGIPCGARRIVAFKDAAGPMALDVNVSDGASDMLRIALPPPLEAYVDSQGVHYPPGQSVLLGFIQESTEVGRVTIRAEMTEFAPFARSWFELDGYDPTDTRQRAIFVFGLPNARFQITEIGDEGPPRFRPYSFAVEGHYQNEELEWIRPRHRVRFGFHPMDDRTGVPISDFSVYFGPGGHLYSGGKNSRDERFWHLPDDLALEWMLSSPGYAPAFGDETAFEVRDEQRVATVRLQRGWGAGVYFRAGNPDTFSAHPGPWAGWTFPAASGEVGYLGAPPVPSVEVLADGFPVGTSDERGALPLVMPAAPQKLTLRCEGWRLVAVSRVSWLETSSFRHVVWMYPE